MNVVQESKAPPSFKFFYFRISIIVLSDRKAQDRQKTLRVRDDPIDHSSVANRDQVQNVAGIHWMTEMP